MLRLVVCLLAGREAEDPGAPVPAAAFDAWSTEGALLEDLKEGRLAPEASSLSMLEGCVARSWFSAAGELMLRVHDQRASEGATLQDVRQPLTSMVSDLKRHADEFGAYAESVYRGHTAGLDEVHCAVQWAQNSTVVFLAVKFAVRWSAPGAIEMRDLNVSIAPGGFTLTGFGHHSSIRKRYVAGLELHGALLPEPSSWSASSVGRLTAILHKAVPAVWPRLLKKASTSKSQIGTWMDMQEQWADELSRFKKDNKQQKPKAEAATKTVPPPKKEETRSTWQTLSSNWRKLLKRLRKVVKRHKGNDVLLGAVASAVLLVVALCCWLCRSCCGRGPKGRPDTCSPSAGNSAASRLVAGGGAPGAAEAEPPTPSAEWEVVPDTAEAAPQT